MIYITNNPDIRKHIIETLHISNCEITDNINSILKNQLLGILLLVDGKTGDIDDIDILLTTCDIALTGSFPRIRKGDLVIFREGNQFLYKEV